MIKSQVIMDRSDYIRIIKEITKIHEYLKHYSANKDDKYAEEIEYSLSNDTVVDVPPANSIL